VAVGEACLSEALSREHLGHHAVTGECRFDPFDPVIDLSPTMEKLAHDPRILGGVSALYREQKCER
jgi:hypothetical protein